MCISLNDVNYDELRSKSSKKRGSEFPKENRVRKIIQLDERTFENAL